MKNIYLIDLLKDKSRISQYISNTLLNKITTNLENLKKTIIYLNKRGAYNLLICEDCSYYYKCPKCDIAMSVHSNPERLLCNHCLFTKKYPQTCEKCKGTHLKKVGVGTQQIENSLRGYFPNAKIFRMDSDNVKNKKSKNEALENIINADIIIGTKMITTGFDLENIGLIGVILIEQELSIPKYDTEEKIRENITQLIGRGGRVGKETDVIIQTYMINNTLIENIFSLNYKEFFIKTIHERKIFNYPPFCEYVTLRYKNKDYNKSLENINKLKEKLLYYNTNNEYEILKIEKVIKRDSQYFSKIIIKGHNIRNLLEKIKKDIFSQEDLTVIFD